MTEHFAVLENGTVHYWRGGSGDPLVMIHGLGVDGVLNWPNQFGPLAKEYDLIVPDLLWFGESSSDKEDYSYHFQAQTIKRLLDALGIGRFHVMGHSLGGWIAATLAAELGNHVQKLIIVNSPAVPNVMTEEEERRHTDLTHPGGGNLFLPQTVAEARHLQNLGYHKPPSHIPSFVFKDLIRHFNLRYKERAAVADYMDKNLGGPFLSQEDITQETLIVWGQYDVLFPVELAERVVNALGTKAQLKIVPDAGHAPNLEKPKEFNQIVLDFLRSD